MPIEKKTEARFVFQPVIGMTAALKRIAKRKSEEDGKPISISYLINIILLNDYEVQKEMRDERNTRSN